MQPYLLNMSRLEAWSFFEPPPDGGDPDYTLAANRATLGVRVAGRHFAMEGAFQYAQLVGLPRNARVPGPLGPGALYYASARAAGAYQLYFRTMALTLRDLPPGLSVTAGRQPYVSGEGTPYAGRLVGTADWTLFERAFDGVRAEYVRSRWRTHASFFMPTQGAFEESASPTITQVRLWTANLATGGLQAFAHRYRDTRDVQARPDNTAERADRVDIAVQTIGATYAWTAGALQISAWGAVQRGDWYGQRHRAFSVAADLEQQWTAANWQPAVRASVRYASGDGDPVDEVHGTFFPMLPTTSPDLLSGTFAQMNLRDLSIGARLHPARGLTLRAALHHLALADEWDRWYSGTGATAFAGTYFGFSTRQSGLRTGLGTFAQLSLDAPVRKYWTMRAAGGWMQGGEVIRRHFAGDSLFVFALENRLSFR